MGKMKELLLQAKDDFKNLRNTVRNHKGSMKELMGILRGYYPRNGVFFSVQYGCIDAVIYTYNNKFYVCEEVDIWDSQNCEIVSKGYIMEE